MLAPNSPPSPLPNSFLDRLKTPDFEKIKKLAEEVNGLEAPNERRSGSSLILQAAGVLIEIVSDPWNASKLYSNHFSTKVVADYQTQLTTLKKMSQWFYSGGDQKGELETLNEQINFLRDFIQTLSAQTELDEPQKRSLFTCKQLLIEKLKQLCKLHLRTLKNISEDLKPVTNPPTSNAVICERSFSEIKAYLQFLRTFQKQENLHTRYQRSKSQNDSEYFTTLAEQLSQIKAARPFVDQWKEKRREIETTEMVPVLQKMKVLFRKMQASENMDAQLEEYKTLESEQQEIRLKLLNLTTQMLLDLNDWLGSHPQREAPVSLPGLFQEHLQKAKAIDQELRSKKPGKSTTLTARPWVSLVQARREMKDEPVNDSYLIAASQYVREVCKNGLRLDQVTSYLKEEFSLLVPSFEKELLALKKRKAAIKKSLTEPCANQEKLEEELSVVQRKIYATTLLHIIEGLRKKQHLVKNEAKNWPVEQQHILFQQIQELNKQFEKTLQKYKTYCSNNKPLSIREIIAQNLHLQERIIPVEEFETEKHYADLGYYPSTVMKEWAQTALSQNRTLHAYLMDEISAFYQWADAHPHTAANLSSDIALVLSILHDDGTVEAFKKAMLAKVWTTAFLKAWNTLPQEEPIEQSEELKYRALADYCAYAPIITGVGKGLADGIAGILSGNAYKIIISPLYGLVKATAVQKTTRFIPDHYNELALLLVQIVQGESFQNILMTRRNIELIKLGGLIKNALLKRASVVDLLKKELQIWMKTMKKAGSREKFFRATLELGPALGIVAVSIKLIVSPFFGSLTLAHINSSISVMGFLITILKSVSSYLKIWYDTRSQVEKELLVEENCKRKETLTELITSHSEYKEKIENESQSFLRDLQKYGSLPFIIDPQGFTLTKEESDLVQQSVEGLEKKWEERLNDLWNKREQNSMSPSKCIQFFNQQIQDFSSIRSQAAECVATYVNQEFMTEKDPNKKTLLVEKISSQLVQRLIQNWLRSKINVAMIQLSVELSMTSQSTEDSEKEVHPDLFLKEQLKLKNSSYQASNQQIDEGISNLFIGLEKTRRFSGLISP
jgi:hypothetical protein